MNSSGNSPGPEEHQLDIALREYSSYFKGKKESDGVLKKSFASVLNSNMQVNSTPHLSSPAIVLDDSCISEIDLSVSLIGKVIIDAPSLALKEKLSNHGGVASWFQELIPASNSFVNDDRIVWVSVEGLSIKALTRNTFAKILSLWGDFIDVEAPANTSLSYKKICVKTKNHVIINDRIKIIVKGKVYWIRVKELEPWIPDFNHELEDNSSSDEESEGDISEQHHETKKNGAESDNDLEIDHVSETSYMNENDVVTDNHVSESGMNAKCSEDPFGICKLLNSKKAKEASKGEDPLFPPGFTPIETSLFQRADDIERIGLSRNKFKETKMESIDLITIKELWGNSSFNYAFIPVVGFSEDYDKNVYAPRLSDRKALWDYIKHFVDSWSGESIILEYFNEVRSENERFGSTFYENGANAFNHFITRAGLIALPLEGYSFTWTHPSASKMSKLDRFLVSEGMIVAFSSLSAICLERHLSDHRPILLRELDVDYGPSPFRLYHSWYSKDGFDDLVEQTWKSPILNESNSITLLKKKFQVLKASIKQWCKEDKRRSNSSKSSIQAHLLDLNAKDSLDMAQKAKIRWSVEGDENSKFFHGIINKKRSQLAIRGIFVEGDWVVDPNSVKNEFFNHFANRFSSLANSRIIINSQFPTRLSLDQIDDLEMVVSYDEIKRAVWDCGANKSPGLDGFTFEFFRRYWSLIDHDVVAVVSEFFSSGKFPSGCNASFITLILETQDAKLVKDFRHTSLIGSIYKIITKIMSNRITLVIYDLVNDVQSAFVAGRQILDGPFILNELILWCKHHKTKTIIFKVDFEKAFDSVRWDYLDDILDKFGFGLKWRSWIQGCLNSAKGSILVNGCSTSESKFHKGLKQGDPLSPFLFILVMESLHIYFKKNLDVGLFKGIQIDGSMSLSHLFYADDVVFIGKWEKSNISTLVNVLNCFSMASGLKINLHKSKLIGIGISHNDVTRSASLIGCKVLSAPFSYLGVKVGGIPSRHNLWEEVIVKISARISKWKLKTLSIGDRLTLTKAVLSSIPLYQMSMYRVPMGVLNRLESTRRDFFNGAENKERKLSLIAWKKNLSSKSKGSLGISSLFALWSRFIKAMFGARGSLFDTVSFQNEVFVSLFALEDDKLVLVSDKLQAPSLSDSFRRPPHGGIEDSQLTSLAQDLVVVVLSSKKDRWVWSLNSSGLFSVKSARAFIDNIFLPHVGAPTRWVSVVPIKINIFAWRLSLDKLPMRLNLSFRGIDIPSIICPICSIAGESSSYIFFNCHVARDLLGKVARWWELELLDIHAYKDWLSWFITLRLSKRLKDILEGVFYTLWWSIWRFRNQVVFRSSRPRLDSLFDEVVQMSYNWCSSISNCHLDWLTWMKCPSYISL
ncbi:RNA-directed DNA polymerase, eukaryota [Tanacetum coccineum]